MVELRVLASDDDWPVWQQARLAALSEAPHAFKARLADWPDGGEDRWRARLTMPGADATYELRSVWVSARVRGRAWGTC